MLWTKCMLKWSLLKDSTLSGSRPTHQCLCTLKALILTKILIRAHPQHLVTDKVVIYLPTAWLTLLLIQQHGHTVTTKAYNQLTSIAPKNAGYLCNHKEGILNASIGQWPGSYVPVSRLWVCMPPRKAFLPCGGTVWSFLCSCHPVQQSSLHEERFGGHYLEIPTVGVF